LGTLGAGKCEKGLKNGDEQEKTERTEKARSFAVGATNEDGQPDLTKATRRGCLLGVFCDGPK
jgi:hypothetical protein